MSYNGVFTNWPPQPTQISPTRDYLSSTITKVRNRGYYLKNVKPLIDLITKLQTQWISPDFFYDIHLSEDFKKDHENTLDFYISSHGEQPLLDRYHYPLTYWLDSVIFIAIAYYLIIEDPSLQESYPVDSFIYDWYMKVSDSCGLGWTREEFYNQIGQGVTEETDYVLSQKISLFIECSLKAFLYRRWSSAWQYYQPPD